VAFASVAADANAGAVTLGRPDLAGPASPGPRAGGGVGPVWSTELQTGFGSPGTPSAVPADGTQITSWRVRANRSALGEVALLVLRPGLGGELKAVSRTIAGAVDGSANDVSIDVQPGDQVGITVYCGSGSDYNAGFAQVLQTPAPGAAYAFVGIFGPPTGAVPLPEDTGNELLFNATVQLAAPVVTGIDVTSGPASGGTRVVLSGTHLASVTGVSFGDTPAVGFSTDGAGVTAVSPAHAPGPVQVTLTAAGGSANPVGFTYDAPPASSGPADSQPPVVSLARIVPGVFRAANLGGSIARARARVGARVTYALTEPAQVTFSVQRRVPGHRRGTVCAAARGHCVRWPALPGAFTQQGVSGGNALTFTGRIGRRALKPGRYRLVLQARDAAGNTSKPVAAAFTITAG